MTEAQLIKELHTIIGVQAKLMEKLIDILPQYKELYQLLDRQSDQLIELTIDIKKELRKTGEQAVS